MDVTVRQEMDALLPLYLNGSLDGQERTRVERLLAEDSDAVALLSWHRSLRDQLRETTAVAGPSVPSFASVRRAIRVAEVSNAPLLGRRVRAWIDRLRLAPSFAMATMVVIVGQGVILAIMHVQIRGLEAVHSEYRAAQSGSEIGPFIRVSFKMDAKEADVRMLLVGLGATYVGGPSQLGDYYVYVSREQIDRALVQIKASQFVSDAALVATVPPIK